MNSKDSIFDYTDYKTYLRDWLAARPGKGRGEKSRIASALRCDSAYITHVFSGSAHLSLEQASDLSAYLGHRNEEQRFFILLVQLARAGNRSLKAFLNGEIRKTLEERLDLQNRLRFQKKLSDEDQAVFYSNWYYLASYAAVSVPAYQTPQALAQFLGLPLRTVSEVLHFLESRGILLREGERYRVGTRSIHLGNDSYMINKHHTHWRLHAIRSLDHARPSDLHYSSVVSLSREDAPRVRAALVKAIEEVRGIVAPSPEESVYSYALDFFELKG